MANLGGSLSAFFANCSQERKVELASKLLDIKHGNDTLWTFYIENIRLLIGLGMIAPIRSLAQWGLDRDAREMIQKSFELADLWRTPQPASPLARK